MDNEDVYEEVGRHAQQSEVPDRCRNVIQELIDTEASYLNSLRDVLHGYQEPIRAQTHLPVKAEDVDTIFSNTQELHNFSKRLLKLFEISRNDMPGLASIFLDAQSDFKIYTTYCTNHPRSIKTLSLCQQQPTAAEFFYGCQLALGHMLPLSAFLLKPVQRILKYHLLIADMLKQYGKAMGTEDSTYSALQNAQVSMAGVANYINAMMRKEEARELLTTIQGWNSDVEAGSLVLEGVFRCLGAKVKRKVYLFENLLLMAKRHKDNVSYVYKGHITHANLTIVESPSGSRDPLAFQLYPSDNRSEKNVITLFAKDVDHKTKWVAKLRRLVVDHYPNITEDVRQKMIETLHNTGTVGSLGALAPAPAAAAGAGKDRLQRTRVTKNKKPGTVKDKNANTSHLDPEGDRPGDVSSACSLTSMDSELSTQPDEEPSSFDTSEDIYSACPEEEVEESTYGTIEDCMYGIVNDVQPDDQLQFCPSDDNDSDPEDIDATDSSERPEAAPATPTVVPPELRKAQESTTTDEIVESMDKPEVVVPMASDYRFSAPQRATPPRGFEPCTSSSSISTLRGGSQRSQPSSGYTSHAKPSASTSRVAGHCPRAAVASKLEAKPQTAEEIKQKEKSMELTKGLVGRLVKKYTALTDEKPTVTSPVQRVSRQFSSGVISLATRSSTQTADNKLSRNAAVARNELQWEQSLPSVINRLDAHQAKAKSTPGSRASVGIKRSKSAMLQTATTQVRPVQALQRSGSIQGRAIVGVTCANAAAKESDANYPSLYAVCAELRRDGWRINRKIQLERKGLAYSGTKTVAYTGSYSSSSRRKSIQYSSTSTAAPSGRVRDLIAKFSVQPM